MKDTWAVAWAVGGWWHHSTGQVTMEKKSVWRGRLKVQWGLRCPRDIQGTCEGDRRTASLELGGKVWTAPSFISVWSIRSLVSAGQQEPRGWVRPREETVPGGAAAFQSWVERGEQARMTRDRGNLGKPRGGAASRVTETPTASANTR